MSTVKISWIFPFILVSCIQAQDLRKTVEQNVTLDFVESEVTYLASDDRRGRNTGSPELNEVAGHISELFEKWGVGKPAGMSSYLQKVPTLAYFPPSKIELKLNDKILTTNALAWNGKDGLTSAAAVFAGFGEEGDYEGLETNGKIVVLRAGNAEGPSSSPGMAGKKLRLAFEKGAIGVIELTALPAAQWGYYSNFLSKRQLKAFDKSQAGNDIPYLWVNDPEKSLLASLSKSSNSRLTIDFRGAEKNETDTYNVIGFVEGSDPVLKEEVVVLSAHYDHVGVGIANQEGDSIYNGARDNAVGTTAVLAAAKVAASRPAKRSLLFVLFTAEEKGMLGSKYFVENPPVPLEKIVFNLNSDNAGYNDTTRVTVVGLNRTTAAASLQEAGTAFGLTASEDPAPEQNLFDRSDNVQFAAKGIPAPTFSLGFTGFDATIGQYYHQPADEANSLNFSYVTRFVRSYVYAGLLIANAEAQPFWVEGDKYYEQGLKLYGDERQAGNQ